MPVEALRSSGRITFELMTGAGTRALTIADYYTEIR
jgi:hypothetical protein